MLGSAYSLYICTTYYHVYVLLLKRLTGKQIKCDVVICNDIVNGEKLKDNLILSGLFRYVWFVDQTVLPEDKGKNRLDRILFQHKRRAKAIRNILPFKINEYKDIYIFHDDTALGRYLNDEKMMYHLVEDSYNFFQHIKDTPQAIHIRKRNWKYWFAKLLNVGYFPMGESKYVLDIEVNENKNLQINGKPIVEISRDAMRSNLSKEDKKVIYNIFGCPKFPDIKDNIAVLLTQPFYLDGVCDEAKQYAMYNYIIKDLSHKGYNVIMKPHPRDLMDYSACNVFVTERYYPIEILADSLSVSIACAAAVSSSAVFTIKAKKIYLYKYLLDGGKLYV